MATAALARPCCPFLSLGLRFEPDGGQWLELEGAPGVKAFLRDEFSSILTVRRA